MGLISKIESKKRELSAKFIDGTLTETDFQKWNSLNRQRKNLMKAYRPQRSLRR